MPICKKCKNKFPNSIKIDGKRRNLQKRRFCLDCSPHLAHNTRDLTKILPGQLLEDGRKLCLKCNQAFTIEKFYFSKGRYRPYCKTCEIKSAVEAQHQQKQKIVDFKGGQCQKCGYNRCLDALELHHHDPNGKESSIRFTNNSWHKVVKEIEKCELLCANCHREVHKEMRSMTL